MVPNKEKDDRHQRTLYRTNSARRYTLRRKGSSLKGSISTTYSIWNP